MPEQYSLEDHEGLPRLRVAWDQATKTLSHQVTATVMERFIKPLKPAAFDDGLALFSAPSAFVIEWVQDKFLERFCKALSDELGENVRVEFRLKSSSRPVVEMPGAVAVTPQAAPPPARQKFLPIDRFRFDSYVVGQSNRLAVAGAKAVADQPGLKYNPLFIYGASGLGKTHLLNAIAHEIINREPGFHVEYISAQHFTEEFVHALQNGKIDQFRRSQRNVGIWLVDDIQFVAGKDRTQEEIFHTFNYLQQIGKQIVLCSDRPPRELFLMDERLRSRFESGLVADIQPPDTETRCAIILSKAAQDHVELNHEVAMYMAEHVPGNIRILEGALTKLAVQAGLEQCPITIEFATEIVERYYRSGALMKPGFNQILDAVGRYYKIPVDDIKGTSRKSPIANARHIAVYITREITGDSWKHIGSLFGDRDHTSMMHAYQKISEMMSRDKDMNAAVKGLIRNLYPET